MAQTPARRQPGPRAAIPLGRWFGIRIGADWSWLIIFWLVTLSLSGQLAEMHPEWTAVERWSLGLVTSVLFFVSIILHELGHSITAIQLGVPVRSITLFIFGGLARIEREPDRPRDEFLIAAAGPAVSLALAALFFALALGMGQSSILWWTARWLARINFILALFNMIPGFPLDGGRVLRAILWHLKGDLAGATRVAARVGSFVAYGFIAWGIGTALIGDNLIGGMWLGFIGWFLLSAAKTAAQQSAARQVLAMVPAGEVMDTGCRVVGPEMSLREVVETGVLRQGLRCFLVGEERVLTGMLTMHEIRRVPQEEWDHTSVQATMVRFEDLQTIAPQTDLFEALKVMDQAGVNQVPVVHEGRLLGILNRERLLSVLRNQMEVGH